MKPQILGLHHITAIANNAKLNHDFYTKVLGLRLVKKTVNFDDPGTYHFYYGNENGAPGTILTFFPWEGIGKGRNGSGIATNISYSVPANSFQFWENRFKEFDIPNQLTSDTFGAPVLNFEDPDGLTLSLVAATEEDTRLAWINEPIQNSHGLKGFAGVTLSVRKVEATADILTSILGYEFLKQEANVYRFIHPNISTANIVDIKLDPTPGYNAAGTNHHVAFRVQNEEHLMAYRELVLSKGLDITPKIDRDYFFSLYFREPGGILFEIATDNPGFERDEPLNSLGSTLKLPKQYEGARTEIERILPKLTN